jgi:Zn-dependent membrane protease YugP
VTEYHGEGRCLTRVRCILRVRRGFGWNFLLWFVIAGLMITTRHLLVVGILGVVAAAVWVPVALWLARREMQKHARAAAQAAGLQEMR